MPDQRKHRRFRVRYEAKLTGGLRPAAGGTLTDLSQGGACLMSEIPIPIHGYLQVQIILPNEAPILIDVAAVRWNQGRRSGLEFLNLRPEQNERLQRVLRELDGDRPEGKAP